MPISLDPLLFARPIKATALAIAHDILERCGEQKEVPRDVVEVLRRFRSRGGDYEKIYQRVKQE